MNPTLRDIMKEEVQKLLDVDFIYPISESLGVSPLVLVPNKYRIWCICIDCQELNKSTLKDYFPLSFINQVLDTLTGKKYFSFWMALAVITRYILHLKIGIKLLLHVHGVHFLIEYFPLAYVMPRLPFKE